MAPRLSFPAGAPPLPARPHRHHSPSRAIGLSALLALGLACARAPDMAGVTRPTEHYDHMAPTSPSRLHVPLHITREALVEVVNAQLPAKLLDERDFGGYGVQLEVQRAGRLELAFRQNPTQPAEAPRLTYEVPLRILVRKNALITTLRAEGDLVLQFATAIGIRPDWEVYAQTELSGHRWTRTPELGIGGLSIPIEGLTTRLIQRIRRDITKGIDDGIAANVSIREALLAAVNGVATPQTLSEEFGGYFVAEPRALGMAPLAEYRGGIVTVLQIDLLPRLGLGQAPPARAVTQLPLNTGVDGLEDHFSLTIHSMLGYPEMRGLLARSLVDTTLAQAGREATVREVEVYGQGERIVIGLRLTGDYNGWAYLRAKPVFDADSERMELRDIDVDLDTRNLLHRAVGTLFRGRIHRALDEQVGDQVAAQLEAARQAIAEQFGGSEVTPGVRLDGTADRVRVREALVTPEGISAAIEFEGSLAVTVLRIPTP